MAYFIYWVIYLFPYLFIFIFHIFGPLLTCHSQSYVLLSIIDILGFVIVSWYFGIKITLLYKYCINIIASPFSNFPLFCTSFHPDFTCVHTNQQIFKTYREVALKVFISPKSNTCLLSANAANLITARLFFFPVNCWRIFTETTVFMFVNNNYKMFIFQMHGCETLQ